MLIATIIFIILSIGLVVIIGILDLLLESMDKWNVEIKRGLHAHLFVCVTGVVFYSVGYYSSTYFVVTTDILDGEHLIARNFHWLVSTPLEWYIYKLCFLRPDEPSKMVTVYASCAAMQIFGILMCVTPFPVFFFVASSVCFVLMFWMLYKLPQVPETAAVGRRVLDFHLFLWSAYPVAQLGRSAGWLSVSQQQVLVHSFLDCCAKGLSFSAILVARLTRTLTSMTGAIQMMVSTHDVVLIVDETFRLLEPLRDQSPLFHDTAAANGVMKSLLELCANEEHRERLERVAQAADRQPSGMSSPKCMLNFKLRQDLGEVKTTCFVSKCAQGRRIIGITFIAPRGEYAQPAAGAAARSATEALESVSAASGLHSAAQRSGAAWDPALHSCSALLQLAPWLSELVRAIFKDSPTVPSALVVFDRRAMADASVETASAAFSAHMSGLSMPFALSKLLGHNDIERLLSTAFLEDLSIYQFRGAELASGARVVLSMLWLNRLSKAARSSDVRVGVLTLEPISRTPSHGSLKEQVEVWDLPHASGGHYFWYFVASRLLRLSCALDCQVAPPVLMRTTPELVRAAPGLEEANCWHVFVAEPIRGRGAHARGRRDRRVELALPAVDWQSSQHDALHLDERLVDDLVQAAQHGPRPEHLVPPPPALQPLAYIRAEDPT